MGNASLPKGTRDFIPAEIVKRKYIFSIIESVFIKYGYLPIETPTMEALETLTGKYGDEGDKLLFKVLNNGDFLDKSDKTAFEEGNSQKFAKSVAKRGLRYDLTVPFARFVVMHQNEIALPFKRYQIQPVWRADRPQKGRYQEFYQCDVDVVGSDSLMYEAELVCIYHEVFSKLGLSVKIKINNRKTLFGIAEAAGIADKFIEMTTAIDKLDKVGLDGVEKELAEREINQESISKIKEILQAKSISDVGSAINASEEGKKGIEELEKVFGYLSNRIENLEFDSTLARGLSYYTGCIFEVKLDSNAYPEVSMGSIGGGGRYDNLTGSFGLKGISGVGVSFGAERIYDVLEELNLFPQDLKMDVNLLFAAFDDISHLEAFKWVSSVRSVGISADIYPEPAKMKKQLSYANARNIPFVAIIGEEERNQNKAMLKNLESGEQRLVSLQELIESFKL